MQSEDELYQVGGGGDLKGVIHWLMLWPDIIQGGITSDVITASVTDFTTVGHIAPWMLLAWGI